MPPSPSQDTPLPPRQILFIEAFCTGETATQAAIGAGYSPKTAHVQGSRMLKNVKVLSQIKDRMQDPFKAYTHYLMAEKLGAETEEERGPLEKILSENQIENARRKAQNRSPRHRDAAGYLRDL